MNYFFSLLLLFLLFSSAPCRSQQILLFEDFETGDFAAKGWYDGFDDQRTGEEYKNGSYSYEGHFAKGATTSGAGRHLFMPTEKLYISYWVKYSDNYIGSGVGYHPHEWNILTNKDGIYQGPADTYLTLYVEQNAGRPIIAIQDSRNVDPNCILLNNNSFVGCNGDFSTYPFTEARSVSSCNGLQGFIDKRDCFPSSGSSHGYYSSRAWDADMIYFQEDPGPYYKNDWHFIEAYFELNTIENGIGIPNGKIRYWYDKEMVITSDSILFRTAIHPDMKFNQLFYGPYIGVGSPVDQTWWIDDLTLADGILSTGLKQPGGNSLSFNIYPNPSHGNFYMDTGLDIMDSNGYEMTVFDLLGKSVFRKSIYSTFVDLQLQLPIGMYYIQLKNGKGEFGISKIIIQ